MRFVLSISIIQGLNVEQVEQWAKTAGYKKSTFKKVEEKKETATIADAAGETKRKNKTKKKRKPRFVFCLVN